MDLADRTAKTLIAADMNLYLRMILDPRFLRVRALVPLTLMPFLSAHILDSYKYVVDKSPELAESIEPNRELLKHSRLRIKPLEINDKNFRRILENTTRLTQINSNWLKEPRLRILKPIYTFLDVDLEDLGIYFMDGEIISATNLAFMNMGVTEKLIDEKSLTLRRLNRYLFRTSRDYGNYSADLYLALAEEALEAGALHGSYAHWILAIGETYDLLSSKRHKDVSRVDESLSGTFIDLHSEPFYERIARTRGQEQIAATILLLAAVSQVNTARLLVSKMADGNSLAALKIRFLSLYHATQTLKTLSNHSRGTNLVHPQTLGYIKEALGDKSVRRIRKMEGLRNSLIHYGIRRHIVPRLSEDLPLAGLIEAHTNEWSLADLWNEVSVGLDHVANALRPLIPDDLAARAKTDLDNQSRQRAS